MWTLLPLALYGPLDEPARSFAIDSSSLFGQVLNRYFGFTWVNPWLWPFFAAALIATIVSAALLVLIAKLDPARTSLEALRWCVRTLPCMLILWIVFGAAAWLASSLQTTGQWGWLAWIPVCVCVALVPFLCLRSDMVATAHPALWWRPQWPGCAALVVTIAVLLFLSATGLAVQMLYGQVSFPGDALVMLCDLATWVAGLYLSAIAIGFWLRRAAWRERKVVVHAFASRATILALATCDLRLLWLFLAWVVPPVLLTAVNQIFVDPQVAYALETGPGAAPPYLRGWRVGADAVVEWWWVATVVPSLWISIAAYARAVWLTRRESAADS